ncbi:hypothetical protein DXG03_006742, partial [Asterophora parasitica]
WRRIEANDGFARFGALLLLPVAARGAATVAGISEEGDGDRSLEEEGSTEERDEAGTPDEEDEDTQGSRMPMPAPRSAEPGPSQLFLHSVTLRQRPAAGDATEDTDALPVPKRRHVRAFTLRGEHAGLVEVETVLI